MKEANTIEVAEDAYSIKSLLSFLEGVQVADTRVRNQDELVDGDETCVIAEI